MLKMPDWLRTMVCYFSQQLVESASWFQVDHFWCFKYTLFLFSFLINSCWIWISMFTAVLLGLFSDINNVSLLRCHHLVDWIRINLPNLTQWKRNLTTIWNFWSRISLSLTCERRELDSLSVGSSHLSRLQHQVRLNHLRPGRSQVRAETQRQLIQSQRQAAH